MPAQLKTRVWQVLVWCCCLVVGAHAIRRSETWREEYPPIFKTVARVDFTLTRMLFTYTDPDPSKTSTTLKMCSETPLSDDPVNTVVTVVFGTPGTQEYAVDGKLVDGDTCAEFDMAYLVPDTTETTTYTLVIDGGTLKTSTVTFAMTVDVTVLSCFQKPLSRVSWTGSGTAIVGNYITSSPELMFSYIEEDLTNNDVCFTTVDSETMEICRHGGVDVASDSNPVTVNYLAYDPVSPDPAHLSLLFNDDTEKKLEVTLWESSGGTSVLVCDGACTKTPFALSDSLYEMCAFLKKTVLRGPQSGFASVQDVKLVAYNMGGEPLFIEFGFTNSNADSRLYIASLSTEAPDPPLASVHLDCAGVDIGHTCYGFIAPPGVHLLPDNAYVSVQFTDTAFENPTNRIAAKVQPVTERRTNFSSLRNSAHSAKGRKPYSNTHP